MVSTGNKKLLIFCTVDGAEKGEPVAAPVEILVTAWGMMLPEGTYNCSSSTYWSRFTWMKCACIFIGKKAAQQFLNLFV